MPPTYRSQVPRCWEVTRKDQGHFFAFGLKTDFDSVLEYGIISQSPEQQVTVAWEIIENCPSQRQPLPRSVSRLVLTGKPLVESAISLQTQRHHLHAEWDRLLSSANIGRVRVGQELHQELWSINHYLEQLYRAIAQLYHQVVHETELIQFDGLATTDSRLEQADLRAEHVERLLDTYEKKQFQPQSR